MTNIFFENTAELNSLETMAFFKKNKHRLLSESQIISTLLSRLIFLEIETQ